MIDLTFLMNLWCVFVGLFVGIQLGAAARQRSIDFRRHLLASVERFDHGDGAEVMKIRNCSREGGYYAHWRRVQRGLLDLEHLGLLVTQQDPTDGYVCYATLTERGRKAVYTPQI